MNHIYRSIWNEKTGAYVAVSENTSSAGKASSSVRGSSAGAALFALKTLSVSLMLALGANVYALPPAGTVTAGGATINTTRPGSMVINQSTQNVAINWQNFNIAAGESVQFVQPNSNSVALNRVIGSDPSSILGNLSANGKVFLINPNGILFGKGASVNVGGLVGSTLGLSDSDFMAGRYQFSGNANGAVVNQGAIAADGGYVALVGGKVDNQGSIVANRGMVALAAGSAVTLDVLGGQLLNVTVDRGALGALAQNGGLIQADGGQVMLSAQGAGSLLGSAVNNSGVIRARTLENHNGVIRLLGDTAGASVTQSGTLDASGRGAGERGGQVTVLGQHIALTGTAAIDAAGDAGGGTVLIGGNYQGKGAEAHALSTSVDSGAVVHADAVSQGNGGQIVVWSDGATTFGGTLTARGGARSGNGGLIETSGKTVVRGADAYVNTLAPQGKTGTWLLDPVNYTIALAGGDETPAQVAQSLASSNRVITATNDITVGSALTWTTPQTLELNAGHDVLINAAITASTAGSGLKLIALNDVVLNSAAAITASGSGSKVSLDAGRNIVIDGALTTDGGGSTAMRATNNIDINGALSANGGGALSLIADKTITINSAVSADGGLVTLRADNDGTGPGVSGGTVVFAGIGKVSGANTLILFNPNGYANTAAEIAAYGTKVVGALDARAWVFARAENKVYDATNGASLGFIADPRAGGDVTLVPGIATFSDKNVGVGKAVAYSGYNLGGADVARFALFGNGSGSSSANITALAIVGSINAANKVYDGKQSAVITSRSLNGVLAADAATVSYTGGSATFADQNAGNNKAVLGTGLGLTGANAGNYTVNATASTAANITPAPLTVTATDVSKVYGQTAVLTQFNATGMQNGETVGNVTENSIGAATTASVAGGPYAIVPSAAGGGTFTPSNYTINYVNGALTVTPALLMITATDASKVYGQTPTLSAFTSTALQNGETIGSVTETSTGTLATAPVPGPYPIIPSDARGGTFTPSNYAITYLNGALVVTPAPLSITANNVTKAYGETPDLSGFTSSALQNGESIGRVTGASPGAAADAAAPGPYAITPGNAAGGSFTPANYAITYIPGALVVTPAVVVPPVIVAPPVVVPPVVIDPPVVVVPPVVVPPVVEPPVVVPPVVTPPVVVPPVVVPPVVTPPVVVPPVVVPPVVTPPVVVPPVVVPPVVTPPVVVPPVVVPPVVTPPVVVPPVVVPPVVTPPVVVPPVVVPPVVTPPVVVPPVVVPPVLTPPVVVPPVVVPPVVTPPVVVVVPPVVVPPVVVIPPVLVPPRDVPPVVVPPDNVTPLPPPITTLVVVPPALPPGTPFVLPPPVPPVLPPVPVVVPPAPPVTPVQAPPAPYVPVAHPRKQDRN